MSFYGERIRCSRIWEDDETPPHALPGDRPVWTRDRTVDVKHIKIDIINHTLPLKVRSWIDMIGHIFFLVPFCVILIWTSIPFFLASYHQNEQSFSAGGLPQWPAKGLIMIGLALLLIQAISEIIKRAAIMQGLLPDPNADAMSAHELAELEAVKLAQAITTDPHITRWINRMSLKPP